jgi:hypothetical protein
MWRQATCPSAGYVPLLDLVLPAHGANCSFHLPQVLFIHRCDILREGECHGCLPACMLLDYRPVAGFIKQLLKGTRNATLV